MVFGFEEVDQRDGVAMFGEEPDAGSLHSQEPAAGFGNGLERAGEIAAGQSLILSQFPESLLRLFQKRSIVRSG
jgi:hypothetical protein